MGNIYLQIDQWDLLRRNTSLAKFVGELTVMVFGREYMETHSLSGKRGSHSEPSVPTKPAADKNKIASITGKLFS
jgi:hypothetical protein